ncbi:acyltransferase [Acinetobacter sp.]|uniref:acyltransferase n=1 Tax=Acinetobacter sp. TaxID=472 RepID=UPI002FCCABF9
MNQIDITAKIHPNVKLGKFNRIGKNVVIEILGDDPNLSVTIGDNNIINDNTRIFIHGKFSMGDWNVLHNDMLLMAEQYLYIGHNCWFGQNTILDGAGGLVIGNGVRVGMYSQIWTHVASGEQIEGCTLYSKRETIIEDDVWLVGSCIVGSGLKLGWRSVALINSVLTKDTLPDRAYAGSPAKLMEKAQFYITKSLDEKFELLNGWLNDFVVINSDLTLKRLDLKLLILENTETNEKVRFSKNISSEIQKSESIFYLEDKTFIKTNSLLERQVYKYLYNNKARFLPR